MWNIRAFVLLLTFLLSGCIPVGAKFYSYKSSEKGKYRGHYKVGGKYKRKGKTYKPYKYTKYRKVGIASWYGSKDGFHGKKTANGDIFNKHMLTAAHPTLPLPSIVKVTHLKNKKSILVMVNDRGPFKKNRILDLSERAATLLGYKQKGIAKVRVEYMHNETKALLWKLSLSAKHGARPHAKMQNPSCSVACYLNKINRKHARL